MKLSAMPEGLRFERTLIVGGTGMLARVSRYLSKNSQSLTIASRHPHDLAAQLGGKAITLNWREFADAQSLLENNAPFDLIVSWVHDEAVPIIKPLENLLATGGRSIRVHGCESAVLETRQMRNAGSRHDIARQTIILGWVIQEQSNRWLTHGEISAGVIDAIQHPSNDLVIVGTLSQD